MDLIVFWLTPVLLFTVLIVLLIKHTAAQRQRHLTVIEPINLLLTDWRLVRSEPESLLAQIEGFKSVSSESSTTLEHVFKHVLRNLTIKNKPLEFSVASVEPLAPLSTRFDLTSKTGSKSMLIGPIENLESFIEESASKAEHQRLSHDALINGYLPLSVSVNTQHGSKANTATKFSLLGTVIIEPVYPSTKPLKNSSQDRPHIKFLTELPEILARHVYDYFEVASDKSVDAKSIKQLKPVKFAEAEIEKADIVSSADHDVKHLAIRTWQSQAKVEYFSCLEIDRELPITPQTNFHA